MTAKLRLTTRYSLLFASLLGSFAQQVSAKEPKIYDDSVKLELFAQNPDIVTPIGAVFDHKGRLLVIESHTHKRGRGYKGPEKDRIRIVEDTDDDGKADRFRTFFEGTESTMSLARGPDNWIYVATRMKVFRIRDTDADDQADEQETIVHLETTGDYPHNGLAGLAFDGRGNVYFGMGENLGAKYRMIGSDGATQGGSGEGGVFRCDLEGKHLKRIAIGFWNPFGVCVDEHQRVFAVGNDPSNSPPCRLVHVVETGDFGFQYKYGRSGNHALQAWNGELPGTLPMVAGTGEAPCEVKIFQGQLWVAVWGDNRIERFKLQPEGASFRAKREVVVQGDKMFRPVAFADAPDGSIYFTDWVDRSYPVHGKGRIWRLSFKGEPSSDKMPAISPVEQQARDLAHKADWDDLKTDDLFLRQAAIAGMTGSKELNVGTLGKLSDARQRLGLLQAVRWNRDQAVADKLPVPLDLLKQALQDDAPQVRLYAVRWIADAKIKQLREEVETQLSRNAALTPELFKASLITMELLDKGEVNLDTSAGYFIQAVKNNKLPASLRALALQMVPADDLSLKVPLLRTLLENGHVDLQREVVRTLAVSNKPERFEILKEVVANEKWPQTMRADALLGLASGGKTHVELLQKIADKEGDLRDDATQALKRISGKQDAHEHLPIDDLDAWMEQVGTGGDADAGWRVFYGSAGVSCASCHSLNGRGAEVGPGLTGIAGRTSRRDVLESILQPSRDIAPQYVPVIITTDDGRVHQGLSQGTQKKDRKTKIKYERFLANDGTIFRINPARVETRRAAKVSIMPEGLHTQLSLKNIHDLLALLSNDTQE